LNSKRTALRGVIVQFHTQLETMRDPKFDQQVSENSNTVTHNWKPYFLCGWKTNRKIKNTDRKIIFIGNRQKKHSGKFDMHKKKIGF